MGILIRVSGLRFRYPDGTEALRGIDFQLAEGETVILFGANGSGKTTFLLRLVGLLEGEGEVEVCGLPVRPDTVGRVRRHVGFVFEESDEQLFMPTVLEDAAYGPLNLGMSSEEASAAAREALIQVGMEKLAGKPPYHLSAGEKRRAALAGILAMKPDILVLDEPTISLDPPGQRDLVRILEALPQAKIISTHDSPFAQAIGSRAVFFEKGKVAAEGSVESLIRDLRWEPFDAAGAPRI